MNSHLESWRTPLQSCIREVIFSDTLDAFSRKSILNHWSIHMFRFPAFRCFFHISVKILQHFTTLCACSSPPGYCSKSFLPLNYTAWLGRILPMVEYNPYYPIHVVFRPQSVQTKQHELDRGTPTQDAIVTTIICHWVPWVEGRSKQPPAFSSLARSVSTLQIWSLQGLGFCPFLGGVFLCGSKTKQGWRILFKCNLCTYIITMIWDWNTMNIFSSSYYCNQIDNCPKIDKIS